MNSNIKLQINNITCNKESQKRKTERKRKDIITAKYTNKTVIKWHWNPEINIENWRSIPSSKTLKNEQNLNRLINQRAKLDAKTQFHSH